MAEAAVNPRGYTVIATASRRPKPPPFDPLADPLRTLAEALIRRRPLPFLWAVAHPDDAALAARWRAGGRAIDHETILVETLGRSGAMACAAIYAQAAARFVRNDRHRAWATAVALHIAARRDMPAAQASAPFAPFAPWDTRGNTVIGVKYALMTADHSDYRWACRNARICVVGEVVHRSRVVTRALADLPPPTLADVLRATFPT